MGHVSLQHGTFTSRKGITLADTSQTTWLLRYIVTAETAAIVMMVAFFATGFQDLVSVKELSAFKFPYLPDKGEIKTHILKSENTLSLVVDSLTQLNERIAKETAAINLRITILEREAGVDRPRR